MKEENYGIISSFERENWWYRGKRNLFYNILNKINRKFNWTLDLGCGVGSNFNTLKRFSNEVVGVDYSSNALSHCKSIPYSSLHKMSATELNFKDGSFDLVLCSDVLEHVNDKMAVSEITRVIKPGGFFIFSVPAHQYLWGPTDIISEHKKRYEKREIISLLGKNYTIKKLSYWNSFMLLPNILFTRFIRIIGKEKEGRNTLTVIPRFLNLIFYYLICLENQWFIRFNNPEGVSIVGIAQKNA